ncbi:hypothetical protein VPH35_076540 [Triticum aestivum]
MTRRSLLLALLLAVLADASAVSLAGTFGVPLNGTAAFYGNPHGAGSQAGICGYGPVVAEPPFSSTWSLLARSSFLRNGTPGRDSELRASPTIPITYQFFECAYNSPVASVAYRVDPSATPDRFHVILLYVPRPGDLYMLSVVLTRFTEYGWEYGYGRRKMQAPLAIRVESIYGIWNVTAQDVIPEGWHGQRKGHLVELVHN